MKRKFKNAKTSFSINQNRLNGCKLPHKFRDITPGLVQNKRYRCSLCSGEIDKNAVNWYRKGLKHATQAQEVRA